MVLQNKINLFILNRAAVKIYYLSLINIYKSRLLQDTHASYNQLKRRAEDYNYINQSQRFFVLSCNLLQWACMYRTQARKAMTNSMCILRLPPDGLL